MSSRRPFRERSLWAAAGLIAGGLWATEASAVQSKTWVVSWFHEAMYSQDGDCPNGLNPVATDLYHEYFKNIGKTPDEISTIFKNAGDGLPSNPAFRDQLTNRGRIAGKPVNVYQNPTSWPDPHIRVSQGRLAYGFNLDGKGASSPNTFEDPETHERGVNNQLARAYGCIEVLRAAPSARPTNPAYLWGSVIVAMPAWIVTVSGDDLTKDGDVTVTLDRALEHPERDANGDMLSGMTFRIDPDTRSHNVLHGKSKDGTIVTDPAELRLLADPFMMPEYDFRQAHLRLTLEKDGTLKGFVGGYVPWLPIYWIYGNGGLTLETNIGIDFPGLYYALRQAADAYPDPRTGQNTAISATYRIEAIPAIAVGANDRPGRPTLESAKAVASGTATGSEPATNGGDARPRRLTPDQYRRTIADIFGPSIKLGGRFEPDIREEGLLAVGSGHVSVTASGLEQYDGMANAIAAQVVSERYRPSLMPCKPAVATQADDACAGQFLAKVGRLLYRRPLTPQQLQTQVKLAGSAASALKSFYAGLEMSLSGMLESPQFLFRQEIAEPDPDHAGQYRLDAFSKAARLSYLLWNTTPDEELLAAAESGALNTRDGVARQTARLLASARLEAGVRAFFRDMLGFDNFDTLAKDASIFPKFTPQVARDAEEQTLRTIADLLLRQQGDYRDLFTTRKTFMTPTLGAVYGVAVAEDRPNGAPESWVPYEFPAGDSHAGILTQASFVALHSHPGRSSPTLRGKALREILLCQKVPDPPGNVNFTVVQDTSNPRFKTARERVTAHRTDPTCAGCHKIIDPIGLALENFDSLGAYRAAENGAAIDASGELDGVAFSDVAGLSKAVHDSPVLPACLVNRAYSYAVGHTAQKGEGEFVKYLEKSFAADGYRIPALLRRISESDAFYRVSPMATGALENPSSKLAAEPHALSGDRR